MRSPQEQSRRYDLNPTRIISIDAVQAVVADLGENPKMYFQNLSDKRIKGTHFAEIIHPEFQIFRIGMLGFEIPVSPEDKERFAIPFDTISSLGHKDIQVPKDENIEWDDMESINTMRAFVASVFFEEAKRQKLPIPAINDRLIDPPPAKKYQIDTAVASKPGMFLYDWEDLESRWKEENPEFYQETVTLKDKLKDYYASRLIRTYRDLPEEYVQKIISQIHTSYDYELMAYAIRTYAMFTPRPPTLIEIKKVKPC